MKYLEFFLRNVSKFDKISDNELKIQNCAFFLTLQIWKIFIQFSFLFFS